MNLQAKVPDFDTLVALHRQDPDAFEQLRKQLLEEAVATAPARHRPTLEKVLDRIEVERSAATTPMEAVVAASRLMQESVGCLMLAWEQAQEKIADLQATLLIEKCRTWRPIS